MAVTTSAPDQEWREVTRAKSDRRRVQKQIKEPNSSCETPDNPLSLEARVQESEDRAWIPMGERMQISTHLQCVGRLCAWLTLNEAVCLPKWIFLSPITVGESSIHLAFISLHLSHSSLSALHHAGVIISLPQHQWGLSAGLGFTPLHQKFWLNTLWFSEGGRLFTDIYVHDVHSRRLNISHNKGH